MPNDIYRLTIDDADVEFLSRNLGFGDPYESNIWFIGNEERLRGNETIHDRIDSYLDDTKPCVIGNQGTFFTKRFSDYQDYASLWPGYKFMQKITGEQELEPYFISEFYFLHADGGEMVSLDYTGNEGDRNEVYEKNNNLRGLLVGRINFLFSILTNHTGKTVYLYYSTKNLNEKKDLLLEVFTPETSTLFNENKGEWKMTYNGNTIYFINFLPSNPYN